jgi:hypothetical protein
MFNFCGDHLAPRHLERPSPFGANISKEVRHPEHSEGSPTIQEMSRLARHDELLWERRSSSSRTQCCLLITS